MLAAASYAKSGSEVMTQHINVLNYEISRCDCSIVLGRNVDKHIIINRRIWWCRDKEWDFCATSFPSFTSVDHNIV